MELIRIAARRMQAAMDSGANYCNLFKFVNTFYAFFCMCLAFVHANKCALLINRYLYFTTIYFLSTIKCIKSELENKELIKVD